MRTYHLLSRLAGIAAVAALVAGCQTLGADGLVASSAPPELSGPAASAIAGDIQRAVTPSDYAAQGGERWARAWAAGLEATGLDATGAAPGRGDPAGPAAPPVGEAT